MRITQVDKAIRQVAHRQYELISRLQAFELGASTRYLDRRINDGDLLVIETAVLGLPGHPMTWRRMLKACELGTTESAVGALAAAALHELTDFRACHPELVVPPSISARSRRATIHRQVGALTTVVHGIRVTTVAQTLFDVASRVGLWRLERAMDDAILGGKVTVAELDERRTFYEGARRDGMPRMRALVAERTGEGWTPPASELEARHYAMLDALPSRPRYERQVAFPWRPAGAERVDAFLPDHGVIAEADGRRWHARVADFDKDRWRDNQAAAHGLRVVRFTWVHLTELQLDVIALMEQVLAAKPRFAA